MPDYVPLIQSARSNPSLWVGIGYQMISEEGARLASHLIRHGLQVERVAYPAIRAANDQVVYMYRFGVGTLENWRKAKNVNGT